ncbi:hypothetical protein Pmar_PMAR006225 [Perkinsus marinus ATCC 50983]|uniref:Uncharacterized protein n=1 Tax=Perkinsus marinus (strain ATCC 50983 / TXsc) TaxID=423536 RepID=C5LAF9_PERM5|nr:hypothetical protein Pmar_PMAR006225 [Perkinsus marinus ATCC 50983]EER06415.1 hypothetical protein Pmar_PMAR006225 [Perkinsus marinus ATCC 50983]|eukprot:XP_002774599.1 hypothetical protein Pmar_PMAR006225 [Perkinsus marinus ATCC 50983]
MMFPQKPDHGKVVDVASNAVPKSPHSAHPQQHLEPSEAVGVNHMLAARGSCRAFAEQSCLNPALDAQPDAQRILEQASDSGLATSTRRLSVEQCREDTCDAEACVDTTNELRCRGCLRNCFRYCLFQHELLCMRRLCASSILAAVDAFVRTVGSGRGPWAGKGEALSKAIGVHFSTLQGQQIDETAKWVHQILDRDVTHPQCTEDHTADSDPTGYLRKLVG